MRKSTKRRTFLKHSALFGTAVVAGTAGVHAQETTTRESFQTVLSVPSLEFPFFVRMQNAFEQARDEQNVTGSFLDARNSQSTQISQIEDAITNDPDVIMMSPITSDGAAPAVQAANDAGIPVLTIDRDVSEGETVTNVASDNVQLGARSSALLLEFMQEQGDQDTYGIVELSGTPGASVTNERSEGLDQTLEANDNLEVLGSQTGEFSTPEALSVTEDFITRFGDDINGVYAQNDLMALGASRALDDADRGDVPITGIDGSESWVETFADDEFHGTIAQLPEEMVFRTIEAGKRAVRGEDVEDSITIEGMRVTHENVQEYLQDFFGGGETTTADGTATADETTTAGD